MRLTLRASALSRDQLRAWWFYGSAHAGVHVCLRPLDPCCLLQSAGQQRSTPFTSPNAKTRQRRATTEPTYFSSAHRAPAPLVLPRSLSPYQWLLSIFPISISAARGLSARNRWLPAERRRRDGENRQLRSLSLLLEFHHFFSVSVSPPSFTPPFIHAYVHLWGTD